MLPKVISLDHLVLTVADVATSVEFYERVLGMEAIRFRGADGTVRWALRFGDQKINLHQTGSNIEPIATAPSAGSADLCFLTETGLPEWVKHLAQCEVVIETGPVPRSGATGPINSLYLRDPDGNLIEISTSA